MARRDPQSAIRTLHELRSELERYVVPTISDAWRIRAATVIATSLGSDHYLVTQVEQLPVHRFSTSVAARLGSLNGDSDRALGLIDAAVEELRALPSAGDPHFDEGAVDPGLWDNIKSLVEAEEWSKIPADVVTYVEHEYRVIGGAPQRPRGGNMVGRDLFAYVLGKTSALRLGAEAGEWEGWMFLGMGLVQAVGNVDRHLLQTRNDSRRYAYGVIGLGSLLLTQMKYQHRGGGS